jgi:agmatinase
LNMKQKDSCGLPFGGQEALEFEGEPRIAVLPVPYDATTSFRGGTKEAPAAILEASAQVELYDDELDREPISAGVITLPAVEADARGPQQTVEAVAGAAEAVLKQNLFLLTLGGEHTVSLGPIYALARAGVKFDLVQIDAHADMRNAYQNSPFSHACVMRRALEHCRVVGVGIRSFSREEADFMRARGIQPYTMRRIRERRSWMDELVDGLDEKVYLSVDLDGFDPSVCPGVGTPEPGGLGWYETLDLIRALASRRRLVGADIVECLPQRLPPVSEFLAARLAYKIIGYYLCGRAQEQ